MTNELAIFVNDFIVNKGIRKGFICDKLNCSNQALVKLFNKKNFTIQDANKILSTVGYKLDYNIIPISDKQ